LDIRKKGTRAKGEANDAEFHGALKIKQVPICSDNHKLLQKGELNL